MKEQWKDVVGYEGLYQVSDIGRVRRSGPGVNTTVGRILVHLRGSNKYPSVALYKNGVRKQRTVHSLSLQAFVGPCPPGMECCHHDGDRGNPRLINLRWDTRSGNRSDSTRLGTCARGSGNGWSKLDENQVRAIKKHLREGKLQGQQIAKLFGIAGGTVSAIKHGRLWSWLDE